MQVDTSGDPGKLGQVCIGAVGVRKVALGVLGYLASMACAFVTHAQPAQRACYDAHSKGQELRLQGSLLESRDRLLECARASCPDIVTADCVRWLSEIEQSIATVVFAVADQGGADIVDARITDQHGKVIAERGDGRAVAVDPGVYEFHIAASGFESAVQRVAVRESEKNRIVRVTLAPIRAPLWHAIPVASYVLAGTGLVGLATFAAFGLWGKSIESDLLKCQTACPNESELQSQRTRNFIIADIGVTVGALGLASAVAVYFLIDPKPTAAKDAIHARVSPHHFELRWQAHF